MAQFGGATPNDVQGTMRSARDQVQLCIKQAPYPCTISPTLNFILFFSVLFQIILMHISSVSFSGDCYYVIYLFLPQPQLVVLRAFLYAQGSLLEGFRVPYVVLGVKPGSVIFKASLNLVLSL